MSDLTRWAKKNPGAWDFIKSFVLMYLFGGTAKQQQSLAETIKKVDTDKDGIPDDEDADPNDPTIGRRTTGSYPAPKGEGTQPSPAADPFPEAARPVETFAPHGATPEERAAANGAAQSPEPGLDHQAYLRASHPDDLAAVLREKGYLVRIAD